MLEPGGSTNQREAEEARAAVKRTQAPPEPFQPGIALKLTADPVSRVGQAADWMNAIHHKPETRKRMARSTLDAAISMEEQLRKQLVELREAIDEG